MQDKSYRRKRKRLMPNDKLKWVRVYDKQTRALDRYTVVFGDKFPSRRGRYFTLEMNEEPLEDGGYLCLRGVGL